MSCCIKTFVLLVFNYHSNEDIHMTSVGRLLLLGMAVQYLLLWVKENQFCKKKKKFYLACNDAKKLHFKLFNYNSQILMKNSQLHDWNTVDAAFKNPIVEDTCLPMDSDSWPCPWSRCLMHFRPSWYCSGRVEWDRQAVGLYEVINLYLYILYFKSGNTCNFLH